MPEVFVKDYQSTILTQSMISGSQLRISGILVFPKYLCQLFIIDSHFFEVAGFQLSFQIARLPST